MSGMGGSPFGSAHQDVLGQTPSDPESKQRLVDEIKDRARKAFGRRDMPVCEALYSKALKVLPDAPLYSNRSAVRLALGRFDDAFEDATKATQTDGNYAKGYYRLGQAGEVKSWPTCQSCWPGRQKWRTVDGLYSRGINFKFRFLLQRTLSLCCSSACMLMALMATRSPSL